MPSHAPLCGINRPHARYWSRTNRIDSILESPPVTSDTAAVPPPTRSPEPKVTRYIVIRNDQHDGSPHHGKIFIVAGNRLAAAHPPEKRQLHTVTIPRAQGPPHRVPRRVPRPPAGPARKIFRARPAGTRPGAEVWGLGRAECRRSRGAGVRLAGIRSASARPGRPPRPRSCEHPPSAPGPARRRPAVHTEAPLPSPRVRDSGHFRSYEDASARPGRNDREDFIPDLRNESYNCTDPSRT
jgi:hypothetical protein